MPILFSVGYSGLSDLKFDRYFHPPNKFKSLKKFFYHKLVYCFTIILVTSRGGYNNYKEHVLTLGIIKEL